MILPIKCLVRKIRQVNSAFFTLSSTACQTIFKEKSIILSTYKMNYSSTAKKSRIEKSPVSQHDSNPRVLYVKACALPLCLKSKPKIFTHVPFDHLRIRQSRVPRQIVSKWSNRSHDLESGIGIISFPTEKQSIQFWWCVRRWRRRKIKEHGCVEIRKKKSWGTVTMILWCTCFPLVLLNVSNSNNFFLWINFRKAGIQTRGSWVCKQGC